MIMKQYRIYYMLSPELIKKTLVYECSKTSNYNWWYIWWWINIELIMNKYITKSEPMHDFEVKILPLMAKIYMN